MKRINKLLGICTILILCISLVGMAMAKPNAAALKTCSDGIDNDGDGYTDLDDPGCANKNDMSELNAYVECDDGIDNDGDGYADSLDSGCTGPTDTDESNCGDGVCESGETQTTCPVDCGYPDSCSDSDGGISVYAFGTVYGYYNNVPYSNDDFCASEGNVYEYYCNGDYKTGANVSCGTDYYTAEYCSGDDVYKDFVDYYCATGACSSSSTAVFVETCEYGCSNGVCNLMPDSCTDTDGGWNLFERGTASGYKNEVPFSYTDYCNSTKVLVEYYCYQSACGSYVFDMSLNETMECYDGAVIYV